MPSHESLRRELGVFGAMTMGLGSILGTGVFVSIGIAAGIAGPAVVLAIAVGGCVAVCNALSSAQLAASHPVSGGTYEYAYEYVHPAAGFTAGWVFLAAKCASAATAALGFAGYLLHAIGADTSLLVPVAAATSLAAMLVVRSGLRRSHTVNFVIVSVTVLALLSFVIAGLPAALSKADTTFAPFFGDVGQGPISALLHASALMFVAYTGYGRIATLGEEVRDPRRNIPRAIVLTLVVSAALYVAVGAVAIGAVGSRSLSQATAGDAAPLEEVARSFGVPGLPVWIALGAMTAMLGVLLNLILGLSRVLLAMGRRGDMPRATARLDAPRGTPAFAVIVIGVLVTGLACVGSVQLTWSFSAFTVLVYYALTNWSALRLPQEHRLYPRAFAWCGLAACLFLAFWVEWRVWTSGLAFIAVGLAWHVVARRVRAA